MQSLTSSLRLILLTTISDCLITTLILCSVVYEYPDCCDSNLYPVYLITVGMAYSLSRIKFKHKNRFLKLALVLNMFPGFMSMIAVYYILKDTQFDTNPDFTDSGLFSWGCIRLLYSQRFLWYYPIFFGRIRYDRRATRFQIFRTITLPLSKPIIVYTALMAFMGPWVDFIFASVILGDVKEKYTVALGLFQMLNKDAINKWFLPFTSERLSSLSQSLFSSSSCRNTT